MIAQLTMLVSSINGQARSLKFEQQQLAITSIVRCELSLAERYGLGVWPEVEPHKSASVAR